MGEKIIHQWNMERGHTVHKKTPEYTDMRFVSI